MLSKDCSVDLLSPSFRPVACARTRIAKTRVLLRHLEDGAMEFIVRRSFAGNVRAGLSDTSAEDEFRAGR